MSKAFSPLFVIILQLVFFVIINKVNSEDIPKFPALLVFGDSSSDTGNNNYIATLAKGNHYPFGKDFPGHIASGRFSNGKLVPDLLVSMLGIKDPFLQPNLSDDELQTGVTFASGGSGYDDLTAVLTSVIPISRQTGYLRNYIGRLEGIVGKDEAQKIINDALIIISAGTNDVLFNFYDIPLRRSQFTIDGYQSYILNRLHDFVKEIYELGGRRMIISGLPPNGCLPLQMTANFKNPLARTCVQTQNADAQAYNKKLVQLLPQIEASLNGKQILYADVYQPLKELITNPLEYGPFFFFLRGSLVVPHLPPYYYDVRGGMERYRTRDLSHCEVKLETTGGCCGTGLFEAGPICKPLTPICADASKYLFFDRIHPGETAYRYLAEILKNEILQSF